ncbi:MAG: hypothetical protein LBB54_05435, partial [Cellulomonadaceae bacterium]|nr:hypothetical protein [Cellulomonadaceae bacterium]
MKPRHRISAALIPFLLLLPLGVPAHADDDPTPEPTVTTTPTEDPSEPPCPEESEEPCPDLSEPPPTPTPTLDPSPEVIAGTTPKLSSPVRVGTKVTSASETGWTAGAALARQWNINGAPVKGETGTLYTPRDTDYGKTLTLTITGS